MKDCSPRSLFITVLSLLVLTACGQLAVQVEPLPRPSQPTPTEVVILPTQTLVAISQPSAAAVESTATLPPPPQATAAPSVTAASPAGSGLKPGAPVKIIKTAMTGLQNGWGLGEVEGDLIQRVLATGDGGKTWQDRTPAEVVKGAPREGLTAVARFTSAQAAWVVFSNRAQPSGGEALVVWSTSDGGRTWAKSQPLETADLQMEWTIPSDLDFLDAQHGWIMIHLGVGMSHDYFAAFTTVDSGQHWKRILDPKNAPEIMGCTKSGFTFTTPQNGWIAGNCPGLAPKLFLYHTVDGGATWSEASLPVPDGKPANYYAQNGIACGISSLHGSLPQALNLTLTCTNANNNTGQSWIYISSDGVSNWVQRTLPIVYAVTNMLSLDEGFLIGSLNPDPQASGAIYYTNNGGAAWTLMTFTAWRGSLDFVDSSNGWVVAVNNDVTALVRTMDGGRTWMEIKPVIGS